MYTKGSNALKTEYYTHDKTKRANTGKVKPMPKKRTAKVSAAKSVAAKRRLIKKRAVAVLVAAFAMAFIVLQRYAAITEAYDKLNKSRAELELMNAKVVEEQMHAEGNLDHKKIDREAERLGLKPPAKEQIKYISLGNTDNGEVLKTEEPGSLDAFINGLSGILEYLY